MHASHKHKAELTCFHTASALLLCGEQAGQTWSALQGVSLLTVG